MKYTALQNFRRVRGLTFGSNKQIARHLRLVATMLEKRGRGEFTPQEVECLQKSSEMISIRLRANKVMRRASALMDATAFLRETPSEN